MYLIFLSLLSSLFPEVGNLLHVGTLFGYEARPREPWHSWALVISTNYKESSSVSAGEQENVSLKIIILIDFLGFV